MTAVFLRRGYIAYCGLFIVTTVCFSSLLFLPKAEDRFLQLHQLRIRDLSNRQHFPPNTKSWRRDQEILFEKIAREGVDEYLQPVLPAPVATESEISNGSDNVDESSKREFIRAMMRHAWDNYHTYAWGSNELRPISKIGHSASIFGRGRLGATIIDAIDTLYIMGLKTRYSQARSWIQDEFDIATSKGYLSVFETNIRFIGGLLSIYALTNDTIFLDKAGSVADALLPAFNTPTGIPFAMIDVKSGKAHNQGWASGGCSILSEFGSLSLELDYLSKKSQRTVYSEKVTRIREVLSSLEKPDGLYPNYVNPTTGKWCQKHVSIGALGDSFYEYLLKSWLVGNKNDMAIKNAYDDATKAIRKHLLRRSRQNSLLYFMELRGAREEHKMEHLACFSAGMFALESMHENNRTRKDELLKLAESIAFTCHESYNRTATKIGPERFWFKGDEEATTKQQNEQYYILRPEAIEGWFYLWRITHKPIYRKWCWDAAVAIENHCKTTNGYSGIRNVYSVPVEKDDVQQSFFLAETLKYLYLTFCDDDVIPLDKWVFNTEAHPIPVTV